MFARAWRKYIRFPTPGRSDQVTKDPGKRPRHADASRAIAADQVSVSMEDTQTISQIPAAPKGATKDHSLGKLDGSGLAQPVSRSCPSSPLSDTPSSSSFHSSSSMKSTRSSNIAPTVLRKDGSLHYYFKPRGYAVTKAKWMSHFRCEQTPPSELRLITWNVDFMTRNSDFRLLRILSYLRTSVLASPPEPACILFQELDAKSLNALLVNDWVRKHFVMAPDSSEHWPATYGNITLVSRSIPIKSAQKINYAETEMGRTAIFVDIPLRSPATNELRILRVANTHLESLPRGMSKRPGQLQAVADMLRADEVDAGVVGGDMNMIGDTKDQNIHVAAGLEDACLFPDDPASHTWGYQPPTQWPARRLDRVFFTGAGLIVDSVEVIGKGLCTKNGDWASDHYGLATTVSFSATEV